MRLTPRNELEFRYRKMQQEMARVGFDAVLLLQNADLFYFTGTTQSGALYLPVEGEPVYLVLRDFLRARMESGLKEVLPLAGLSELAGLIRDQGLPEPHQIGLELDVLPVNLYEKIRQLFPKARFSDATPQIRRIRMVKSHYEIHILQDAAHQAEKVYRRACEVIRAGMSEVELAAELEHLARIEGHQGYVRMRAFNGEVPCSRILSGTDAATPSSGATPLGGMGLTPAFGQGASYRRIERHEPILIDCACCFDGYLVEQVRVISLGEPSPALRRGYQDMLQLQQRMLELAVSRPSWGSIYLACQAKAGELGYAGSFMGAPGTQVSWVGHGIGIEVDEHPLLAPGFDDHLLESGMVFTFEPTLVFPGEGAIGIGNTFYLSDEGMKQLTCSSEELLIL